MRSAKWMWVNLLGIGLTSALTVGWWMSRESKVDAYLADARAKAQAGNIVVACAAYRELDRHATVDGVPRNRLGDIDVARDEWNQLVLAEIDAAFVAEQGNDVRAATDRYALIEQIDSAGNVSPALADAVEKAMLSWERLFTSPIHQAEMFVRIGKPASAVQKYQELNERVATCRVPERLKPRIRSAVDDWAGIYRKTIADARAAARANDKDLARRKYDELKALTDDQVIPVTVTRDVQVALGERARLL